MDGGGRGSGVDGLQKQVQSSAALVSACETRRIVGKHAKAAARERTPFVLVGDLNTLSPLDKAEHDAAGLTQKIRSGPYAKQLSKKFLTKAKTAVDYTPMQLLLDAPLTDVGARGGGHSVPTSINADHMHFATLRLDYCLVNDAFVEAASCASHDKVRAVLH